MTSRLLALLCCAFFARQALAVIAFDADDEDTPQTSATVTWTHVGGASPEGVLIYCATTGSADIFTGATLDGEALTQIGSCADAATETIFGELYFKGTSVNPGSVTAACTTADATTTKWGYSITVNAAGDTQNGGSCSTTADLGINETCSISDPGGASYTVGGSTHGANAVGGLSAGSGFTLGHDGDLGSQIAATEFSTTQQASGAVTAGFTNAADDGCGTFMAIEQVTPDAASRRAILIQ